jgi:hypothetical protein
MGLVNGTGMTNGVRGEMQRPSAGRFWVVRRWQFLAVLVALAIVLPTFIFLSYTQEEAPLAIDGSFDEWSSVRKFGMFTSAGSAPINVDDWAIEIDGSTVYLYLKVQDEVMGAVDVNSFYLFIDNDNSASTGYLASGIGADFMVELDGWNGSVRSSSVSKYGAGVDQSDWNSWTNLGSASASLSGMRLEASADLQDSVGPNAKFLLISKDNFERNGMSHPVPITGGLLIIEQQPGPAIQNGVVSAIASASMLRLTLSCEGEDGTVSNIVPTVSGATPSFDFPQTLSLSPDGEPETVEVSIDTSLSPSGSFVEAFVMASGVTSSFSGVRILGSPASAYVSSAPSVIHIDGAFADWAGRTTPDASSLSVGNENVDIDAVGAVNSTSSTAFYVRVLGDMLGGSYVPMIVSKPSGAGGGGGGGIVIPTKKTGEDVLRVYIDSDLSAVSGYLMSADSKVIGADYLVEIKGLDGEIRSRVLYLYSGQWYALPGANILAENGRQEMELSVSSSSISGSSTIDYIIETTDWKGRADMTTSNPLPARSATTAVPAPPGFETWIIDSSTSSTSATSLSYQRKLFFDGVNFWCFFNEGTETIARYSTDGGVTWSANTAVFNAPSVNYVSIWYDSANSIVYAVGDRAATSQVVYLQRGVVSPATHSIAWSATDTILATSSEVMASKKAFIAKDAAGYLWVIASNLTNISPTRYQLSAFKSTAIDSLASWVCTGSMLSVPDPTNTVRGSIVPAGSSSDMWAVYSYSGNVGARKYTGTWLAETTIYAIGAGNPENTELAPASALVDSDGVLHIVYGNGHEQPGGTSKPFIYYVYNDGAYSVPYRLDSVANSLGNKYPTISVDSTTNNVYAFWIQTDTNGVGITVMGKKKMGGTWYSLAFHPQTSDPKTYLTSVYSAPGEMYICWQWTQNTTPPSQVIFDKIPEFGDVLLPAFFVLVICVASIARARARRER